MKPIFLLLIITHDLGRICHAAHGKASNPDEEKVLISNLLIPGVRL